MTEENWRRIGVFLICLIMPKFRSTIISALVTLQQFCNNLKIDQHRKGLNFFMDFSCSFQVARDRCCKWGSPHSNGKTLRYLHPRTYYKWAALWAIIVLLFDITSYPVPRVHHHWTQSTTDGPRWPFLGPGPALATLRVNQDNLPSSAEILQLVTGV